jgi:hypothetical protein
MLQWCQTAMFSAMVPTWCCKPRFLNSHALSFGDNYSEKKDDLNRLNYIQRRQEDKGRKEKKEV